MNESSDLNPQSFEENMARIGERVERHKEGLGDRSLPEREMVKESLKSWPSSEGGDRGVGGESVAGQGESSPSVAATPGFLPSYLGDDDWGEKGKVQELVEKVIHGNVDKALRDARKLSEFAEDAFHDALVDRVLPEMKRRGMI